MAQPPSQTATRLMQVKVLYTLNDEAKSNCLARCPQPLTIQTARLDQNTEIGIIELRTCIQAIATTSPELVARLGQDYTVYAYDYSEYETPQVGQGMLSWILANSSSTPTAPAHQSRTMVTGKVCRNVLGLFSGGAQEALEVKLRLVPVPTTLQSEYLASLEQYRSASNFPGGVESQSLDAAAWSSLLQTSPTFERASPDLPGSNNVVPPQPYAANHNSRRASTSHVRNESSYFDPSHNSLFSDGPGANGPYGQNHSRPTTPSQQQQAAQSKKRATNSRPSSRNSNRGRPTLKHSASCVSRMENIDISETEDGPRRKRARVTQTDWNGSSNFGSNTESLRVTAATAASIRGARLNNSLTSDMIQGEFGDRPPTPRPRQNKVLKPMPIPSLPRALTTPAHELHHPQPTKKLPAKNDPLGILESSPEKSDRESTASSPVDLPSSPPVVRHPSLTPSSPGLPNFASFQDSGFASGNLDEFLPDFDQTYDGTLYASKSEVSGQVQQPDRPATPNEVNAPPRKLLPGPAPPSAPSGSVAPSSPTTSKPKRQKSRSQSVSQPKASAKVATEDRERTGDKADDVNQIQAALLSAAIPANDARFRSESLLSEVESSTSPQFVADARLPSSKSADHSKKKQAIQVKLAQSIQTGQMPRFCRNCGEINTSTWRKAFVKVEQGEPNHLELSDAETGILTWEAIERDVKDLVTSYRIIKKSLNDTDPDFEEIALCNPCGIWLFKHKQMRPADTWDKPLPPPPVPARRKSTSKPPAKRKGKKQGTDTSEETTQTTDSSIEAPEIEREPSSQRSQDRPMQTTEYAAPKPARRKIQRSNSMGPTDLPTRRTMKTATAKAALQRAIQSSPPRFPGSRVSPIELDGEADSSLKPTSRLLFPSPRKPGEVKSLDPSTDKQVSPLSRRKRLQMFDIEGDKENIKPMLDGCDDFDHLFDERDKFLTTPKQGTHTTDILKTPSRSIKRTPLGSKSGHQRRYSNPETPSRLLGQAATPFSTKLSRLLSDANDGLDGNFSMSPFTSQALENAGMFDFTDLNNGASNGNFNMYNDQMDLDHNIWNAGNFFDGSIDDFLNHPADAGQAAQDMSSYPSRPTSAMDR